MKLKRKAITLIVLGILFLTGMCFVSMGLSITKNYSAYIASPGQFTLTVTKSGTGTGTVTSSPSGINCGSTCSFSFNVGATVTLTETPNTGSIFTAWSGDASGTGSTVNVTMTSNKTVNAEFWAPPGGTCLIGWYRINEGSGSTLVNSAPASSDKLPNLTISGNLSTFWGTLSGFGSNPSGGTNNASATFSGMTFTNYIGVGYFRRPYFGGGFQRWDIVGVWDSTSGGDVGLVGDLWSTTPPINFDDEITLKTFISSQIDENQSTYASHWGFTFLPSSDNKARTYLHDSTFLTASDAIPNTLAYNQNIIKVFYKNYWYYGQIGDVMIYRNCQRTVNDWADIYDHLYSRYGMPARSGWGP